MNVDQFAEAMSEALLGNRAKDLEPDPRHASEEVLSDRGPGWRRETDEYLMGRLNEELVELREALEVFHSEGDLSSVKRLSSLKRAVLQEAADAANLLYMIADLTSGDTENPYERSRDWQLARTVERLKALLS